MSITSVNTIISAATTTTGISLISSYVPGGITLGSGGYATSLTITNTGTVGGAYRGDISGSGTVVNYGVLEPIGFNAGGIALSSGTIINHGQLAGVQLGYGTFINYGTTGPTYIKNGVIIDSGLIEGVDLRPIIARYGLTLILEPGYSLFGASYPAVGSKNGTLVTSAGNHSLYLFRFTGFSLVDVSAAPGITLNGTHEWLFGSGAQGPTLTGFQPGDTLLVNNAASYVSGKGIVVDTYLGATTILIDAPPIEGFAFTTINSTITGNEVVITVPCFVAGTRIRTPAGEAAVQDLAIGDAVETAFAGTQRIKWIGRRSYDGRFIKNNPDVLPICIKAGAIADKIPERDLWVSPGHAICEGGVLIHASRLINGVSILQAEAVDRVDYFHIELEGHHILFAENCPTESFIDTVFRQYFANAHEYATLYGDAGPVKTCLPLIQSGFHLENIRRRLAARSGIPANAPIGPLRGNLDETGPVQLRGWAQDISAPETPVVLQVMADGNPLALIIANEYRPDLKAAGLGSGCHAFTLPLPPGTSGIQVHRATDGATLPHPPLAQAA
jgi:hypothetical protein